MNQMQKFIADNRPYVRDGKVYVMSPAAVEQPADVAIASHHLTKEQWMDADRTALLAFRAACPVVCKLTELVPYCLDADAMTLEQTTSSGVQVIVRSLPLPITHSANTDPTEAGTAVGLQLERWLFGLEKYPGVQSLADVALGCATYVDAVQYLVGNKNFGPYVIAHSRGIKRKFKNTVWAHGHQVDLELHVVISPAVEPNEVWVIQVGAWAARIIEYTLSLIQRRGKFQFLAGLVPDIKPGCCVRIA